jgi:muconolactone delta-isomerase
MPLLRRLRHEVAKSPVRLPLVWIRHQSLRASDVFFASYPRSGSTWLRFLLFGSLVGEPSGFSSVNLAIPDVKVHKHGLPLMPGGGRLIKTHEVFHPEYRKAVYLVRDPRDVALSEYAYQTSLGLVTAELDNYLRMFVTQAVNPFASWRAHVDSWLSAPLGQGQLLIVRFEDLRADPFKIVVQIVEFLGLTPDEVRIRAAIANNTVERMRAKEKETPQRASARGRFIRSGSAGGWRGVLTPAQVQLFRQHTGDSLSRLGYSFDAEPVEAVTA